MVKESFPSQKAEFEAQLQAWKDAGGPEQGKEIADPQTSSSSDANANANEASSEVEPSAGGDTGAAAGSVADKDDPGSAAAATPEVTLSRPNGTAPPGASKNENGEAGSGDDAEEGEGESRARSNAPADLDVRLDVDQADGVDFRSWPSLPLPICFKLFFCPPAPSVCRPAHYTAEEPKKKWRWNEAMRVEVYLIVTIENAMSEIKNEKL